MAETNAPTFTFLGLKFHRVTLDQSIEALENFIRLKRPSSVFTPTAELIVRAHEDPVLKDFYNSTDLLTVDSYVVYYSARLFGNRLDEPVSAARLMFAFLKTAHVKKYRLYLLGASEDVVRKAVNTLRTQYQGIHIVGYHNGYFDFNNDEDIVRDIREKSPDVLFVAMSSPLKENFVEKNLSKMNVPVSIGVGGSFDIIAGKCRLAPEWVSKMGLEWFYRFLQEPRRMWKRYLVTNIKYLRLLVKEALTVKDS